MGEGLKHEITGVKVNQKKGKNTVVLKLTKKEEQTWYDLQEKSLSSGGGGGDDDEEGVGGMPGMEGMDFSQMMGGMGGDDDEGDLGADDAGAAGADVKVESSAQRCRCAELSARLRRNVLPTQIIDRVP